MKIKEITHLLETLAPLAYQEKYDNSGLLTGHPDDEVNAALITLDCTEEIVDEAISRNCGLIIAHHPIIFSGLKKLNGKNYVERTIIKAIRNNIAIYAIHTNLDNVMNGVNAEICKRLGLKNLRILQPKTELLRKIVTFCPLDHCEKVRTALFEAGAGHIGDYDSCCFILEGTGTFRGTENANPFIGEKFKIHREKEERIETIYPYHIERQVLKALFEAHPYEEVAYDVYRIENIYGKIGSGMVGELENETELFDFLNVIKFSLNADGIRYTVPTGKQVKRVAVCGGSGSFLLPDAIASGAEVFVTADFKYHQFFDAEGKIVIADVGHFESEQFTKNLLHNFLNEKIPTFALHLSELNTNPINYL